MAYDERLAERIREALARRRSISEKRMFGGVCFLQRGNMLCGVHEDDLFLRLGPERGEQALKRKHTHAFDVTGRPMKGMVVVAAAGIRTRPALTRWLDEAAAFVRTLPAK